MVETDIEAEIMYKVVVHSQLRVQVNHAHARGDVGNNDSRQRTQPMTGRDGNVWNRDTPLSHKKFPQDIIRNRVGMTAASSVETIKVEVHVFCNCETVERCLRATE